MLIAGLLIVKRRRKYAFFHAIEQDLKSAWAANTTNDMMAVRSSSSMNKKGQGVTSSLPARKENKVNKAIIIVKGKASQVLKLGREREQAG